MNTVIEQNKEWIDATWEKINKKLSRTAVKSRNKIPYTTIDGVHDDKTGKGITWWTNGFWGGMMWLMYKATCNEDNYHKGNDFFCNACNSLNTAESNNCGENHNKYAENNIVKGNVTENGNGRKCTDVKSG